MNMIMTKSIVHAGLLASLLMATGCGKSGEARPGGDSVPAAAVSGPSLYMAEPVMDFGRFPDYESRKASFRFVNNGNATLEVIKVQPTCGCTTTKLDKTLFAPGEGDTIELTFKPTGSGKQSKKVIVFTNDASKPRREIEIRADVIPTLKADPRSLSFGKVQLGSGAKRVVKLTSGIPNYEMGKVTILGDLKGDLSHSIELVPGTTGDMREWKMTVQLASGLDWGWYTGSIRIQGTVRGETPGASRASSLTIGVNANVQGSFRASDSMFRLLVLPQNHTFRKTIRVSSEDESPFEITSARVVDSGNIDMQVQIEPIPESRGSSYDITLMGNTGASSGAIRGKVVVQTSIPGEQEVVFKIAGSIRK